MAVVKGQVTGVDSTTAKIYGEALWQLAAETGREDELCGEAGRLLDVLGRESDFIRLLQAPELSMAEREQLMGKVLKGNASDIMKGFLFIMVRHDRADTITAALKAFLRLADEAEGLGQATVITAAKLDRESRAAIEEKILDTAGFQTCRFRYKENPALIGGIMVRIGDRVYDGSVRTRMENLKKSLLENQTERGADYGH